MKYGKKSNEIEIKKALFSKLLEITMSDDDTSTIKRNDGSSIVVNKKYDKQKFPFIPGQFIQISLGFSSRHENIYLCVGVSKGCPKNTERCELWFLGEGRRGISHFCEADTSYFAAEEERGDLILLEPIPGSH